MENKKGKNKSRKARSGEHPPAELTKKDYIQRGLVILVIVVILATALYFTQFL